MVTSIEQLALDHEVRLIAELHTFVHDPLYNGIGCNHTVGGEGVSGLIQPPDAIEKNRQAHVGVVQGQEACDRRSRSMKASGRVKRRKVLQLTKEGDIIAEHPSVCAAATSLGLPDAAPLISRCCRGKAVQAYGFMWRYVGGDNEIFDRMGNRGSNDARPVEQVDLKTGDVVKIYPSVTAAARAMGKNTVSIRLCCNGKRETAYGWGWKHVK